MATRNRLFSGLINLRYQETNSRSISELFLTKACRPWSMFHNVLFINLRTISASRGGTSREESWDVEYQSLQQQSYYEVNLEGKIKVIALPEEFDAFLNEISHVSL